MGRHQPWSRSSTSGNHWQGHIIDPDELVDPHSDPRSAFTPAVLDNYGECSEPLTRMFLRDKICDLWNLTNIGLFFQLAQCNRNDHKAFSFRTTFTNLSIENCTILWRVAQKFSMQKAATEVGRALKKAHEKYADRDEEQCWVEDRAFRLLARRVDHTQNTTTTASTSSTSSQTTPPTTLQTTPLIDSQTTPSTTLQRQLDATIAQYNESDIESAVARIREPANGTFKFLTVKPIIKEFLSTEATSEIAQLVAGVEEAISRRDKFIVDQLHKEDAKIDQALRRLLMQKSQHEKAEEAHHRIMKLGNYLDALNEDDEPLPPNSVARKALNALEEEIKKRRTKRTSDFDSESATLTEKQKRIKTHVTLLEKTEHTLSPAEVSACVKVY